MDLSHKYQRAAFKKNLAYSCIYQNRNEKEWNIIFFLQKISLDIPHTYSSEFSISLSSSEFPFLISCKAVLLYFFKCLLRPHILPWK